MAKFLCYYPIAKKTAVLTGELRVGLVQDKGPFAPGIILDKDTVFDGNLMKAGSIVLMDPRTYIVAEIYNPRDHVDDFTDEVFTNWILAHTDYPKYELK